jgi:hypothetical protein
MPKVIVTAEVEDATEWEESFFTHGELFRSQTVSSPIEFAVVGDNEIVICFEPEDLDTFLDILESPETADAMEFDGVNRDTLNIHVLDREFDLL